MPAKPIDYDSIADIYDLYVTADYDVAFFTSEVRKVKGPVLELMSGTGRLSLPLLEAGAQLTCVDVSRGMLDILSRKVARKGLEADVRCQDARRLELPSRFELAILPFQAFMEIVGEESQAATLAAIHASLSPRGRFICTLHNPAVRRTQVDGTLRVMGQFPTDEGTLVVSGFETGGQPVVRRLQLFEHFGTDGYLLSKRMLAMEFTLVEREGFEAMARGAGFRIVELFGGYDREPFDPVTSKVMIWVLERD